MEELPPESFGLQRYSTNSKNSNIKLMQDIRNLFTSKQKILTCVDKKFDFTLGHFN